MNVLWVASLLFVCLFVALLFFCFFCYIFLAKSNELRGRARRNQLDMQIDCGAPILFFLCVVFSLVCYFCIFFCPFLHSIPLTSSRTGGKKGRQWGWGGVGKKGIREMKRRTKRTKEEEDKEEEEEEREEEKKNAKKNVRSSTFGDPQNANGCFDSTRPHSFPPCPLQLFGTLGSLWATFWDALFVRRAVWDGVGLRVGHLSVSGNRLPSCGKTRYRKKNGTLGSLRVDILGRAVCPSSRLGRRWSEGGTPFRLR